MKYNRKVVIGEFSSNCKFIIFNATSKSGMVNLFFIRGFLVRDSDSIRIGNPFLKGDQFGYRCLVWGRSRALSLIL